MPCPSRFTLDELPPAESRLSAFAPVSAWPPGTLALGMPGETWAPGRGDDVPPIEFRSEVRAETIGV